MELYFLLLTTFVILGALTVASPLVAWLFVRRVEAEDKAAAARRLWRRTRPARSRRASRPAHPARPARPLTPLDVLTRRPALVAAES
jgi:hypothetical protein